MTGLITLVVGLALGYLLRTRGDENQIRYTRLYEQRATVLAGLSERLYLLHSRLTSWTAPFQHGGEERMKQKRTEVADAFNDFAQHFYSNSLWLDDESARKAEALLEKTRRLIFDYDQIPGTGYQHPPAVEQHLRTGTDWMTNWDRIHKEATDDVGEMKKELESEFKDILGVSGLSRIPTEPWGTQVADTVSGLLVGVREYVTPKKRN